MKKNITFNPKISAGSPTIKGRRLTVYNVVSQVFIEDGEKKGVAEDFELSMPELEDAISYCKELSCIGDKNLTNYCSGCLLREIENHELKLKQLEAFKETEDLLLLEPLLPPSLISTPLMRGWELAYFIDK